MIGELTLDERLLPEEQMAFRSIRSISRRTVLAAAPLGLLAGATSRVTLAQPAAADPVSFYLGQVLALATLQAQAVGRLRPMLASPNATDGTWQAAASAEASVIGAVASVLGGMEPPPELTASVGELRLASDAYLGAAGAAQSTASGDMAALDIAGARLTEGATHVLLWLDALTAETGNDWGDGLRTLTEGSASVPVANEVSVETPARLPAAETAVPAEQSADAAAVADPAAAAPAAEEPAPRQARNRLNRQNRQNQQADGQAGQGGEAGRQNRQNQGTPAAGE